jgi:hypothetical protein
MHQCCCALSLKHHRTLSFSAFSQALDALTQTTRFFYVTEHKSAQSLTTNINNRNHQDSFFAATFLDRSIARGGGAAAVGDDRLDHFLLGCLEPVRNELRGAVLHVAEHAPDRVGFHPAHLFDLNDRRDKTGQTKNERYK